MGISKDQWPVEFVRALEEAISVCAVGFNIIQDQRIDLQEALRPLFGDSFQLSFMTRKA